MKIWFSWVLVLGVISSFAFADKVIDVSVYSIKENTKLYDIYAEYPQIDKVNSEFNEKIKSYIEERIADYKEISKDNWETRRENSTPDENIGEYPEHPFYFGMFWEPKQLNGKYISFVLHSDFYVGGANANQVVTAFNYDVLNNREIELDDLLCDYPNYLETLSNYTIKTLKSNLTEEESEILDEMIQRGAGPEYENFKKFTFTDKMINLHFSKYDVLPGAFGEQEVYVPRSIFVKSNLTISSPNKFAKVKFPLEVKGFVEKRTDQTTWVIFEGEAGSIKVVNDNGEILGTGILKAEGEWMTDEIVKVSGVISLNNSIKSQNAKLIITENNPDDTRKPYIMILPIIIDEK